MDDLVLRPVAGAVVRDGHRVLLMRRSDESTWGLPGGGVEPGESWVAAAKRECLEETGWDIAIDGLLGIYSDPATQIHRYPSGRLRHFVGVAFLATAQSQVAAPGDEATALGWFAADALPDPLFAPDIPVLLDALDPRATFPVIG